MLIQVSNILDPGVVEQSPAAFKSSMKKFHQGLQVAGTYTIPTWWEWVPGVSLQSLPLFMALLLLPACCSA